MSPAPHVPQPDRIEMERLYAQLLSAVVQLAQVLGKPCPIITRAERRQARVVETSSCETPDLMVK